MVRTRFAPSPTGYLHIGGVRTALFNWLFARKHGGQFILRIDDTDQQRNVAEALQPILDGFKWLGIDWDEGPTDDGKSSRGPHGSYFQSQRSDRYQAAVDQLLASGHAYRDYATTEELAAEKKAAEQEKRLLVYSRKFAGDSPEKESQFKAEGRQAVVRMKMPREGACEFNDLVRGPMSVQWASEQDHVIQRADGSFIYHLANVIDDHDFEITHVIRAEEHLSNTPRQIFIGRTLGYTLPEYAHVPFVAEPGSKTKLSKRKLSKYLKSKDFAELHYHGLKIAAYIDENLRAMAKSQDVALSDTQRIEILHNIIERLKQPEARIELAKVLPSFVVENTDAYELAKRSISLMFEEAGDVVRHPELLASYEHGESIANALGILTSATFNPVLVDFYATVGYLPDAILNYILLLGWSLDDKTEDFSRNEMIQHFSLERVNKAAASFDPAKLFSFQDRYMQRLDLKKKVAMCLPFVQRAGWVSEPPPCDISDKLRRILTAAGDRVKVAGDILDYPEFFVADEQLEYDAKAVEKRIRSGNAAELLKKCRDRLATIEPFDAPHVEEAVKKFVEDEGIKIGDIIHALRVAVSGKGVGLGMFDTLEIVGKQGCLDRIDRILRD